MSLKYNSLNLSPIIGAQFQKMRQQITEVFTENVQNIFRDHRQIGKEMKKQKTIKEEELV